jgi:hypothetical protein
VKGEQATSEDFKYIAGNEWKNSLQESLVGRKGKGYAEPKCPQKKDNYLSEKHSAVYSLQR